MNLRPEQEHHLRLLCDHLDNPNQQSNEDWQDLLQHFSTIHSITPHTSPMNLSSALSASTVAEGYALVNEQLARLPQEARPTVLQDLIRRLERTDIPEWEKAPITLCRIDPNLSNSIRNVNGLISVDWEYSGWGDPAYDIADLMAHPQYMDIPSSRWTWLKQTYGDSVDDSTATIRIEAYYKILLVWWVVRNARFLYEVPRGLDNRLVSLPADWQADAQRKFDYYYLNLAEQTYA
jgi:thiamine kinase-like enzyme